MTKTRKQTIYNGQNEETRQSTMAKTRKQTIYNGQNEETDNLQWPKQGQKMVDKTLHRKLYCATLTLLKNQG